MNYKELKQIIQKHNIAYYDDSASMITDAEYDQLYDKLEAMEKQGISLSKKYGMESNLLAFKLITGGSSIFKFWNSLLQ